MTILLLLSIAALGAEPAGAPESGASTARALSLDEVLDLAERRASVRAADHRAAAARKDTGTALLGAVGPRVGGTLTTTERSEEIAIDTPIGAFVQQPKRLVELGARAELPLDPAGLFGALPAARSAARAADLLALRERDRARLAAGEAYLDVAAIDARIEAVGTLIASLDRSLAQVGALIDAELAVQADRLRVDVARSDAQVGLVRLRASRAAAVTALRWRVGSEDAIDVAFAWTPSGPPPQVDAILPDASGRSDLRALEEQRRATGHLARAAALEGLPTVAVYGQVLATDNPVLVARRWVEGGVSVAWSPVAGGTRIARNRSLADQDRALREDLADARAGLRAELEAVRASWLAAIAEIDARDRAVAQAREAERLVAERFAQGLATVTDTLSAASARADVEAAARVARIEERRAVLRWNAAIGAR